MYTCSTYRSWVLVNNRLCAANIENSVKITVMFTNISHIRSWIDIKISNILLLIFRDIGILLYPGLQTFKKNIYNTVVLKKGTILKKNSYFIMYLNFSTLEPIDTIVNSILKDMQF